MRPLRFFALTLALFAGGCYAKLTFHCGSDSARCGAGGVCLNDACAFPASDCPSGYCFDKSAGAAANQCIASGTDLAMMPAADAGMPTGVVFSGASDVTVHELDPVALTVTASDSALSDLTFATPTDLPAGLVFASNGATATLTWTPGYADAGAYPIALSARSTSDATHTATAHFTLTVKNGVDPLFNPFSVAPDQMTLNPVGDVDGDGKADLAFCSVAFQTGTPPQYKIQLLYGDASGLPTARPLPSNNRTQTITYAGPAGSFSTTNTFVSCTGGDIDGDGKSDIVQPDYGFQPNASSVVTGTYWVSYGRPRGETGTPDLAQLTNADNAVFSSEAPLVGDVTGDGLADLHVFPQTENTGAGKIDHYYQWQGQAPRKTGTWIGFGTGNVGHPCNGRRMIGIADLLGTKSNSGKPLNSLVWYDAGMASTGDPESGACSTTTDGGLYFTNAGMGNLSKRYLPSKFVPPSYYLCDVDADHFGDLVVLTQIAGGYKVSYVYGSATYWPTPIDLATAPSTTLTVAGIPGVQCWPDAPAGGRVAITDTGAFGSNAPGVVHLLGVDANRAPILKQDLTSLQPNDVGFGSSVSRPFDFDGDGKLDLEISSRSDATVWLSYGR